ncbi:MAG: 3-phosphoshikimate 1-carboxyvinyltransferase [Fimbriimonadia bacterium]|nr:3-phosphoshikimate 1-carboxyvinyltransferase [Fimbriimonadia bacterium]
METWRIQKASRIAGRWLPPGDKSISHRAVLLGALAAGKTTIRHLLESDDCLRTARIASQLGAKVERVSGGHWVVESEGIASLREPEDVLDAGNSGTTARLVSGVLASAPFFSVLTGDASLRRRPMARIAEPLKQMGASILGRQQNRYLPFAFDGHALRGITYTLPVPSAQVKSCLLLAGLQAEGFTEVVEAIPSRDHTERMMDAFGAELERESSGAAHTLRLRGGQMLQGCEVQVPADFSSAAFFLTAAMLLPGSDLVIERVGINPTRIGLLEAFQQAGAHIHYESLQEIAGEPVATLLARPQSLKAMRIGGAMLPRLIDEVPILAVAATQACGETVITDAAELRLKESDRLQALVEELTKMGADIEATEDSLIIRGPCRLRGAVVHSHGDHRIAMAMAVAGLLAKEGETVIEDTECVQTSFPDFMSTLNLLAIN